MRSRLLSFIYIALLCTLVAHVADAATFIGWGRNVEGQIGTASKPTPWSISSVDQTGDLAGKTIVSLSSNSEDINSKTWAVVATSTGEVYTWGDGANGRLGTGDSTGLPNVHIRSVDRKGDFAANLAANKVAAGYTHGIAATTTNRVFLWGQNSTVPMYAYSPIEVDPTAWETQSITQVGAGSLLSAVLTDQSNIFTWGQNNYGQLGDGTSTDSTTPVQVAKSGSFATETFSSSKATLAVGGHFIVVLADSGNLWAWGRNDHGQLGIGAADSSPHSLPVAVNQTGLLSGLTIIQLVAGATHASVLANNGQVFGWGWVTYYQVGDGSNVDTVAHWNPAALSQSTMGNTITFIGAAHHSMFAQSSNGKFYAWGRGDFGALGTGNIAHSSLPTAMQNISNFYGKTPKVITGGTGAAFMLTTSNELIGWGTEDYIASTVGAFTSAQPVSTSSLLAGKTISSFCTGAGHAVALSADGILYSWGRSDSYQLGNNSATWRTMPSLVDQSGPIASSTLASVACGPFNSFAVSTDGQLYAWGHNQYKQLGDETTVYKMVPTLIMNVGPAAGRVAAQIIPSSQFTFLLTTTNEVWSWGYGPYGALANGSTTSTGAPVQIYNSGELFGATITQIAVGSDHSVGLTSSGKIYSSGYNLNGQLGNGTWTAKNVPVAVNMNGAMVGRNIIQIASISMTSYALADSGEIFAWGAGSWGQLGTGSLSDSNVPVAVNMTNFGTQKVVKIFGSVSSLTAYAVTESGDIFAWGDNRYGQLAVGSFVPKVLIPTNSILPGVVQIQGTSPSLAVGESFALAMVGTAPPVAAPIEAPVEPTVATPVAAPTATSAPPTEAPVDAPVEVVPTPVAIVEPPVSPPEGGAASVAVNAGAVGGGIAGAAVGVGVIIVVFIIVRRNKKKNADDVNSASASVPPSGSAPAPPTAAAYTTLPAEAPDAENAEAAEKPHKKKKRHLKKKQDDSDEKGEEMSPLAEIESDNIVPAYGPLDVTKPSDDAEESSFDPKNPTAAEVREGLVKDFKPEWMIPFESLTFQKKIGQGAFGVVYRGKWHSTAVAIKQSNILSVDADELESFKREALLMLSLRPHPNCVQVLGISVHETNVYVIMELCRQGSLESLLRNGELSLDRKLKIIFGFAAGVAHLHENGIVHRDLAARNILLGSGDEAKVSDFGMSRMVDQFERKGVTSTQVGPLRWMAPESIGKLEYSPKSDVWSWANTVVEILTAKEPFAGVDMLSIGTKVRDHGMNPGVPADCPDWLSAILERCWKVNPAERPTMVEIADELDERIHDM